jgi:pSer/pThr/pTyr-binding forkhead associated (FHA) protein
MVQKLEVKNITSSEVFEVLPEGAVFGRAGGPAQITVADQSVSKRHAKIYARDGVWVLEDMQSVNGTLMNNKRISEPIPLQLGSTFSLSRHQFEIIRILPEEGGATRTSFPRGGNSNGAPPVDAEGQSAQSSRRDPKPKRREPTPSPQPAPRQPVNVPQGTGVDEDEIARDDLEVEKGAGAVLIAFPKAVAYYLKAIPLMALNPMGTVRRGMEDQELPGMRAPQLIAFALPVNLFSALVSAWATGIATLIGGGGFLFGAFFPIVGLIGAVIGSVIAGFITHPVFDWIINKLKGQSDARSRTNYMIQMLTAAGLLAVPTALGVLLTGVAARLASVTSFAYLLLIIPALLSLVTAPLTIFIAWSWFKRVFQVVEWFQKVLLVLLVLSVIGGVLGAVGTITTMISLISSGGGASVSVPSVDGDGDKADAKDGDKADGDKADAKDADKDDGDKVDAKDGDKVDAKDGDKVDAKDGDKVDAKDADVKPVAAVDKPPPTGNGKRTSYVDYAAKRDAVEKAFDRDPTLLDNAQIARLYREYAVAVSKAEAVAMERADVTEEVKRGRRFDPTTRIYAERWKQAEVYKATAPIIDKLHPLVVKE